jgi:hypothetical protein
MANDKKFVVKNGLTTQNISFVDDTQTTNNTITITMLNNDTLSFSGDSGQLFSITDTLTGTIFAVNDISGVPSIEVDDDGTIRFAETFGNVLIGTATDNGTDKLQVDGTIVATEVSVDSNSYLTSGSAALATTSLTALDTSPAATYRTVKYIVQISQGTSYQSSEVLINHNGTTAYMTEYAVLKTGSTLATLSTDISGGNVRLLVTMGTTASATIKFFKNAIIV